jgi:thiamine pyrophosphate-dependent acetolactate synthase large subunit-like protein
MIIWSTSASTSSSMKNTTTPIGGVFADPQQHEDWHRAYRATHGQFHEDHPATWHDHKGYGYYGYRPYVDDPNQIQPALRRARESGKCALINVWVDPDGFSPGTMHQTMYK